MKKKLLHRFQKLCTIIGAKLSLKCLWKIQMMCNYLRLGRYYKENDFNIKKRVANRETVFDIIINKLHDKEILYLEFGVFRGRSIKYWANALQNPASQFYGFDSFEGLSDDFDINGPIKKGHFNIKGEIPKIEDKRVHLIKTWFSDLKKNCPVLPNIEQKVIIMDADLYESTTTALNFVKQYIQRGTYLYFDDMSRIEHDPLAFARFMKRTGLNFELVVGDLRLNKVFFHCIGNN
jgi:Macrocin-O-methyltransferase (TylF)